MAFHKKLLPSPQLRSCLDSSSCGLYVSFCSEECVNIYYVKENLQTAVEDPGEESICGLELVQIATIDSTRILYFHKPLSCCWSANSASFSVYSQFSISIFSIFLRVVDGVQTTEISTVHQLCWGVPFRNVSIASCDMPKISSKDTELKQDETQFLLAIAGSTSGWIGVLQQEVNDLLDIHTKLSGFEFATGFALNNVEIDSQVQYVAVSTAEGNIGIWSIATLLHSSYKPAIFHTSLDDDPIITSMRFSPCSSLLAITTWEGDCYICGSYPLVQVSQQSQSWQLLTKITNRTLIDPFARGAMLPPPFFVAWLYSSKNASNELNYQGNTCAQTDYVISLAGGPMEYVKLFSLIHSTADHASDEIPNISSLEVTNLESLDIKGISCLGFCICKTQRPSESNSVHGFMFVYEAKTHQILSFSY